MRGGDTVDELLQQILTLSSGTIAALSGLRKYGELDAYRMAWYEWAKQEENVIPGEQWGHNHARYKHHLEAQ
jgi:hypothetical protein